MNCSTFRVKVLLTLLFVGSALGTFAIFGSVTLLAHLMSPQDRQIAPDRRVPAHSRLLSSTLGLVENTLLPPRQNPSAKTVEGL